MRRITTIPNNSKLAIVLAFFGCLSVVGAVAVNALEADEGFVVAEGEPGGGTYGPIVASDPVSVTVDGELITPEDCALMASCITIPFEIVVPSNLDNADDFSASIAAGWVDPDHLSDLDMYIWDDGGQRAAEREANGDEPSSSKSYSFQGSSASSANPEIVKLFEPIYGNYNINIFNWLGPPIEVTVYGELFVDKFVSPFELLAPEPTTPTTAPPKAAITATTARPAATTTTAAPTATTTPVLPSIEITGDDAFDDFDDVGSESELAAQLSPEDIAELEAAFEQIAIAGDRPPSDAALLLSMVIAPGLFLSAAGAFLWRRSPAAIDID